MSGYEVWNGNIALKTVPAFITFSGNGVRAAYLRMLKLNVEI
jgi:hypothetical protein